MKTILHLNTSLFSGDGQSSRLAEEFVAALCEQHPEANVLRRDLARDPVPHLDAERFAAFTAKPTARTRAQQAVVDYSDGLIDEIRRAGLIVIGLPMYNFGVPSQLKAWFDHIARAGLTFRYTEAGAVGLLTGKKTYVLATRGGRYAGSDLDTQTRYVRDFLNFLGIDDVEFVYAEGLAMGDAAREEALSAAQDTIRRLARETRMAA